MQASNPLLGKAPADYEEVLFWKATQKASRIIIMNLLSIPLAIIFGIIFIDFVYMYGNPPEIVTGDSNNFLGVLLIGILLVVVLHELAHGIAMQTFGAKPKYGIIWKGLMFYATAPGHAFQRNQHLIISLAPLMSISILACLGIVIQAGTSNVWLWAVWATVNGGAAIGDLWITAITLGYPPYAYVVYEKDGIRILLPNSEGGKK
jgi:hypothetical protein